MSTQIAVRLPDDLVAFMDELIAAGKTPSRADLVRKALRREQRLVLAERDLEILLREGDDPDMLEMAKYVARLPMDLD